MIKKAIRLLFISAFLAIGGGVLSACSSVFDPASQANPFGPGPDVNNENGG
jgi:hypothetical protein